MDILALLLNTKPGNQFVFVMTNRYTKRTRAIPTTTTNATTVARIFVEHWVANCGIPSKLLSENRPHFVSKFFVAVFDTLGVK